MNDIKKKILINFNHLIDLKLKEFNESNKISGSSIGIEIGRIINNEIKDIRGTFKKTEDKKKVKENEKKELLVINSREELTFIYKEFMRKKIDELKKENENKKNKRTYLEIFQDSYNEWKKREREIKIKEN